MEQTLTIIKPDGVANGCMGKIIAKLEENGFQIRAAKMLHLTPRQAAGFYAVHEGKFFFPRLLEYMSSGPILIMVLEREDAISQLRELMGTTDPAKAAEGTIRKLFATSIEKNVIHGSDAPETARTEISYFFNALEQI